MSSDVSYFLFIPMIALRCLVCCLIKQFKVIKCYIFSCETRCVNFFTIIDDYSQFSTRKKIMHEKKIILGVRIEDTAEKEKKMSITMILLPLFCSFETIMKANARPYSHFVVLYRFWMTIADINYRLFFGDKLIFLLCNVNVCTFWSFNVLFLGD